MTTTDWTAFNVQLIVFIKVTVHQTLHVQGKCLPHGHYPAITCVSIAHTNNTRCEHANRVTALHINPALVDVEELMFTSFPPAFQAFPPI